jgi:hypothetical protein
MNEVPKRIEFGARRGRTPKSAELKVSGSVGSGSYIDAERAKITMTGAGQEREVGLVIKHYKDSKKGFEAEENYFAQQMGKYELFRHAGIRHLPATYRLEKVDGRPGIAMTDYTRWSFKELGGGRVPSTVLSTNAPKRPSSERVSEILGFERILNELESDMRAAANDGLEVFRDAFFFVIPERGSRIPMDFVLADYDNCSKKDDGPQAILERNVQAVAVDLLFSLKENMDASTFESYKEQVLSWVKKISVKDFKFNGAE